VALGLKDVAQSGKNSQSEFGKFGSAMIDHRLIDCAQDSIGNVRGTRDLKKMTACMNHFNLEKDQSPFSLYHIAVAASARPCITA
jgi:hypothetical protein